MTELPPRRAFPDRELELASYFGRLPSSVEHWISASECETLGMDELLALAGPVDRARWDGLRLGYTEALGAPWLRAAAADGYDRVSADELVCFAGAQEALYAALHALLGPDDHAVLVLPSYQSMETLTMGLCETSGLALDPAQGWALDLDALKALLQPRTRMVAISFPNNPTGRQLDRACFDGLVELCRSRGIWLLSDEVYRLTEWDETLRLPHVADAYELGISLGVLSKAYGLPGLRVGWVACRDADFMARVAVMRQYLSTCNAAPSEVLATIALHAAGPILARNRAIARSNWALLEAMLARHGDLFDCETPEGGVVCYPRYHGTGGVEAFVVRMAAAGVMLLPASVFRSQLVALPEDRFRVGFGKLDFPAGLAAFERALVGERGGRA